MQCTVCGSVPAPWSIPEAMQHSTGLLKAGGGRGICSLHHSLEGERLGRQQESTSRHCCPVLPSLPRSASDTETSLGQGRGDAWWSLLPGRLEGTGVMPGSGWTFLKGPPKAELPRSEKSASAWDLLQRQLPVFRHSTCSDAVSHTQLQLFH